MNTIKLIEDLKGKECDCTLGHKAAEKLQEYHELEIEYLEMLLAQANTIKRFIEIQQKK